MKTTKKLVVLLLVLFVGVAAFVPSTFSWYDHNGKLIGNKMQYVRNKLPVSAGDSEDVDVTTVRYKTEYEHNGSSGDANKIYYDDKGNKEVGATVSGSDTVGGESTHFYGTTFKNNGDSPIYVNLYLNGFINDPNNYIGTIAPSLTYKNISSSVHLTNKNMVRVYFQWKSVTNWSTSGAKNYVVYKTKDGSKGCIQLTNHITPGESETDLLSKQTEILGENIENTYYADLPSNTIEFYFATDANNGGFNTDTYIAAIPWYRTKTITNVQAETGYFLTGAADDTTWNAQYSTFNIPGGVSVKTCYDTANINKSQHAYVTVTNGVNYTGASASYALYSGSGVSVNANSGYVTAASNLATSGNQIATIRTTITGSLGDSTTVDTNVYNPQTLAASVALNVEVPVDGETEIVWYIQNKGLNDCTFTSVYYTK